MFLSHYSDISEGKSFKINSETDTVTYNHTVCRQKNG